LIARCALAAALVLAPQGLLAEPVAEAGPTVTIDIVGLRSTKGLIRACLTTIAAAFPDCEKDPQALHMTVPVQTGAASGGPVLVFRHVQPGTYAVSLFHDENSNGRLDTSMGIPKEGYGFSRDAAIMFGPPKFDAARFVVGATDMTLKITVRYIL
jgi:uncharacterized protein (DUF2141 family)